MRPRPARAGMAALMMTAGLMKAGLALPCLAGEPPVQRPFETLMPWSLARGRWEAGVGLVVRHDVNPVFFTDDSGTRRDERRLAVLDVAAGLGGGGEARLQFGLQRFHEEGGQEETGIEDARLTFSWQTPATRYGAAAHVVVKLPNAGNDQRLGTDETDLFFIGSAGRVLPRWGWAGQLGFGILGSPSDAGVQDDLLVFGCSAWMPLGSEGTGRPLLLVEVSGYAASRFGNDFRIARAGVRLFRRFPVDLSVRRGLTSESENWGLELGITFRAAADAPAMSP